MAVETHALENGTIQSRKVIIMYLKCFGKLGNFCNMGKRRKRIVKTPSKLRKNREGEPTIVRGKNDQTITDYHAVNGNKDVTDMMAGTNPKHSHMNKGAARRLHAGSAQRREAYKQKCYAGNLLSDVWAGWRGHKTRGTMSCTDTRSEHTLIKRLILSFILKASTCEASGAIGSSPSSMREIRTGRLCDGDASVNWVFLGTVRKTMPESALLSIVMSEKCAAVMLRGVIVERGESINAINAMLFRRLREVLQVGVERGVGACTVENWQGMLIADRICEFNKMFGSYNNKTEQQHTDRKRRQKK